MEEKTKKAEVVITFNFCGGLDGEILMQCRDSSGEGSVSEAADFSELNDPFIAMSLPLDKAVDFFKRCIDSCEELESLLKRDE